MFLNPAPTQVDPLDGTTNFVHGYPFTCVSIGLAVQQQPVVGVVYNPMLGELFYAAKGCGAFLNDKPIRVSDTQGDCHLVTGLVGGLCSHRSPECFMLSWPAVARCTVCWECSASATQPLLPSCSAHAGSGKGVATAYLLDGWCQRLELRASCLATSHSHFTQV